MYTDFYEHNDLSLFIVQDAYHSKSAADERVVHCYGTQAPRSAHTNGSFSASAPFFVLEADFMRTPFLWTSTGFRGLKQGYTSIVRRAAVVATWHPGVTRWHP